MSFVYEERASDSPFVRTIWRTRSHSDGTYIAAADGCWDLLFITHNETTNVKLCGPMSHATPVPYVQGVETFAIRFQLGTFLPHLPAHGIVDETLFLPKTSKIAFWFGNAAWQLPTYENVETFVKRLLRQDLLLHDRMVEDTLIHEQETDLSPRSVQRHVAHTTGLTPHTIRQIERANLAANLLQQGTPLLMVVHEVGYTDQSHMTHALKRFIGTTPAQLIRERTL